MKNAPVVRRTVFTITVIKMDIQQFNVKAQVQAQVKAPPVAVAVIKSSVKILAESWVGTDYGDHQLPIKKIDGVMVQVSVMLAADKTQKSMTLCIRSPFFLTKSGLELRVISEFKKDKVLVHKSPSNKKWTVDMIEKSLVDTQRMLGQLTYDKFTNSFIENEKVVGDDVTAATLDVWGAIKNVELEGDVCCVCHDRTTSKTECGHELCLQCWSSLKIVDEEDDDETEFKGFSCPMCRGFMMHLEL
jgi:hypothetical protein